MGKTAAMGMFLLGWISWAHAQEPKSCAAIVEDPRRLLCYDLIFRTSQAPTVKQGNWKVDEETSKIDDSKRVFINLKSSEKVRGKFGRPIDVQLMLTCREGKTDAYFIFGDHFMSDNAQWGIVTYRIDKQPAKKKRMAGSTDHKALGLWSASEAIPFIRELFSGSSLFVQATPYSENSISAEFNITGLEQAIKPLQAACKWPQTAAPTVAAPKAPSKAN